METRVINIRHSQQTDNEVYIGRAGKGHSGVFGNPVVVGARCGMCGKIHSTGGSTLACYSKYFHGRLETDLAFKAKVLALKGKTLVCFCKPAPCHGDIIVAYLEGEES